MWEQQGSECSQSAFHKCITRNTRGTALGRMGRMWVDEGRSGPAPVRSHQEWEWQRVERLLESPLTEQPQWTELAHLGHRLAEAAHSWESCWRRVPGGIGSVWDAATGEGNLATPSPNY